MYINFSFISWRNELVQNVNPEFTFIISSCLSQYFHSIFPPAIWDSLGQAPYDGHMPGKRIL